MVTDMYKRSFTELKLINHIIVVEISVYEYVALERFNTVLKMFFKRAQQVRKLKIENKTKLRIKYHFHERMLGNDLFCSDYSGLPDLIPWKIKKITRSWHNWHKNISWKKIICICVYECRTNKKLS